MPEAPRVLAILAKYLVFGIVPIVLLPSIRLAILLYYVFQVCVFWGLVNLLPIYPLDGGQIVRELLLKFNPQEGIRQSLILSIVAAGAVAAYAMSHQLWVTGIFFGYLAYSSFATLQAYRNYTR